MCRSRAWEMYQSYVKNIKTEDIRWINVEALLNKGIFMDATYVVVYGQEPRQYFPSLISPYVFSPFSLVSKQFPWLQDCYGNKYPVPDPLQRCLQTSLPSGIATTSSGQPPLRRPPQYRTAPERSARQKHKGELLWPK